MSAESFPAHIELLTPDTVAQLRMRGAAFDHPREYVDSLVSKYHDHRLYSSTFTMASTLFGSTETAPEKHRLSQVKKAFLAGNLLGAELVDVTGGEDLVDLAATITIEFPNISDSLSVAEQLEVAAQCLHENSLQTFQVADLLHPLIDNWGYKIVDRKHQGSLRAGIGMLLSIGDVAIASMEYDALDLAANMDVIDWNKELADMQVADGAKRIRDITDN